MRTIGIVAHSAEGGGLCFLTACRAGAAALGSHMHPVVAMSAVPMALSMPGWWAGRTSEIVPHLTRGIEMVARAGADFFICPDNTAHIVLEEIVDELPLPGLHIAEVVCEEIRRNGWRHVGLLGTRWTMTGPVYHKALSRLGMQCLVPPVEEQELLNSAIFEELCNGRFEDSTTALFLDAITHLKDRGAQCVILGCTEIPIVVNSENSSLPVLDSTRLLAFYAVELALLEEPMPPGNGWLEPRRGK